MRGLSAAAGIGLALLLSSCGSGSRIDSWWVDSLIKVFPDDVPGANGAGDKRWLAPRNGYVNLQLAVRSKAGVKGLKAEAGISGVPAAIQTRHAGYVPVGSNPPGTPPDEVIREAPALYPDPLLENFPFDLPAGETHSIWLTLHFPASAQPGDYSGRVELSDPGGRIGSRSFRVRITRAEVPAARTLKVTNWFSLHPSAVSVHYPAVAKDPELYWTVLGNLGRVMAEHGQNVMLTPVTSLADTSVSGGNIRYSFDRLDRWVSTFEKAGVIGAIEGGHLLTRASGFHSALVVPAYVIEGGKAVWKNLPPGDAAAERYFNGFLPALYAHIKDKGWTGRYIQHIHDEPHDSEAPEYNRYARLIRKHLPGIPTLDAVGFDQDIGFFADVVDIWVPVLGSFDRRLPLIREHRRKGGQCWFYTCIGPQGRYLNRFIDQPLLKTRLLHWFNFRHELTGYLHWGGNSWGPKPFQNVQKVINNNRTLLPAGDNAIVYPAPEKNGVLSSIRLEAMREGIQDYELLAALAAKDAAKARALAAEAIPGINDYVRDAGRFRALEQRLLEAF